MIIDDYYDRYLTLPVLAILKSLIWSIVNKSLKCSNFFQMLFNVAKRTIQTTAFRRARFTEFLKSLPTKEISTTELSEKLFKDKLHKPTCHLLDVRYGWLISETYEWNEDHIPYAVYTGRGNLERDIVFLIN